MVSRSWCYTINNYDEKDIEFVKRLDAKKHVCSKEVGESGTPHLQGAITFSKCYRMSALKKLHPKAHWEITKSDEHATNYCRKLDSEIILDVDARKQGKRVDLEAACEVLKTGTLEDVAEQCPMVFVKYHKGLAALKSITSKPEKNWISLEVIVKVGPPGCGKTRWAFENYPDLYRVSIPKKTGQLWFDGYEGQETILLDDFYGEIAYATLLHLCDGYPMQVQIKGGFVWKNWKRVIFTSNEPMEHWYPIRQIEALRRRVTDVTVTEVGKGNTELSPLLQDSDED